VCSARKQLKREVQEKKRRITTTTIKEHIVSASAIEKLLIPFT